MKDSDNIELRRLVTYLENVSYFIVDRIDLYESEIESNKAVIQMYDDRKEELMKILNAEEAEIIKARVKKAGGVISDFDKEKLDYFEAERLADLKE